MRTLSKNSIHGIVVYDKVIPRSPYHVLGASISH